MDDLSRAEVILCGTGLVQSILASALARAGKKVLHCDASDYYGELDAVWTLPYLRTQATVVPNESNEDGLLSSRGSLQSLRIHSFTERTEFEVQMDSEVSTPYGRGRVTEITTDRVSIVLDHWKLANDSHPTLCIGLPSLDKPLTEHLASLGIVSEKTRQARKLLHEWERSFALDLTPSLLYAHGAAVDGLLLSQVADYLEFKSLEGLYYYRNQTLQPVPCSKQDVFASTLLSPLEKRRLMKFLQLALDYGNDEGLNERRLNQGRSLARPQNKAHEASGVLVGLDRLFDEYLQTDQKLSPQLSELVRYALALEPSPTCTLQQGLDSLCHHMQALGRFGGTAFLAPLYGAGELPQAFCRSAAVYGATYLLRSRPEEIVMDETVVQGVRIDCQGESRLIECDHVVAPVEGSNAKYTKRVLRRICAYRGKLLQGKQQRHVVVVPPSDTFGSVLHGMLFDETSNVVPHAPSGCTLVHWTAVVDKDQDDSSFVEASNAVLATLESDADEIFQLTFSYGLYETVPDGPETLHWVSRGSPRIDMDLAFQQAEAIFAKICPGAGFLLRSEEIDKLVKERVGDMEEDEEQAVLESAMGLVDKKEEKTEES